MIDKYKKRVSRYKEVLELSKQPVNKVIRIKILVIVAIVINWIVTYEFNLLEVGFISFIFLLIGYIYVNIQHQKLLNYQSDIRKLIKINEDGIKRFNGEWRGFKDNGKIFVNTEHPYSLDLDIVGKDSLYQWTNMCETPWGKKELVSSLLHQNLTREEIISKQEAVIELASKVNFRHRLKLEANKLNLKESHGKALLKWVENKVDLYQKLWFIILIRSLPVFTISSIILGPILKILPSEIAVFMIILQGGLLYKGRANRRQYLDSIYNSFRSIRELASVLSHLEKHKHSSSLLCQMKETLIGGNKDLPSKQISKLASITNNISNRKSSVYFIFNILLLWDYQCSISLEKWKESYGTSLGQWFKTIGEFEALSSVARIAYDHPEWTMPTLLDETSSSYVSGNSIGHPLIGQKAIRNSIEFNDSMPIVLVTGSNMSGKSTFLRTIGVNLVLAYCGGPVFADDFQCAKMALATCMRVSDDLAQNISSFYGEILRIKMIIEKVKSSEKVFFILDEIFKGTNSIDRHYAAKAVIHNLNKYHASGMVSTHDLELEVIEEESKGQVKNYHFEESYENGEITFDYKLKRGLSETRNAIYLIKAAGIDID